MSVNKDIENNLLKKRITILTNENKLSQYRINKLSKDYINLKLLNFKTEDTNKELREKLNKISEENKLLEIQICNLDNKNIELTERLIKTSRLVINYGG